MSFESEADGKRIRRPAILVDCTFLARWSTLQRLLRQKNSTLALPIPFVFDSQDRDCGFLTLHKVVELIVEVRGVDFAAVLHQQMDFIVAVVVVDMKVDLAGATHRDLRQLGR